MSVQSVNRTFDIIEILSTKKEGMSLSEIAVSLGLHISTVHRLIATLKVRGYIKQNPDTGWYSLGLKFVELSSSYLNNLELSIEARPHMYELTETTQQTVFMGMLQEGEVVYIDKTETFSSLKRYSIVGTRASVYSTALGKALLMDRNKRELEWFFASVPMEPKTPNTHIDRAQIIEEIIEAAKSGYTIDNEENQPGIRCYAAPVYDYRGKIVAAISTSGYVEAMENKGPEMVIQAVKETAAKVSMKLGFRVPVHQ